MNFKSRLKKLENQLLGSNSEFCTCDEFYRTEIHLQDLSEDSLNTEQCIIGNPVADICERCKKTTRKDLINIQGVDRTFI